MTDLKLLNCSAGRIYFLQNDFSKGELPLQTALKFINRFTVKDQAAIRGYVASQILKPKQMTERVKAQPKPEPKPKGKPKNHSVEKLMRRFNAQDRIVKINWHDGDDYSERCYFESTEKLDYFCGLYVFNKSKKHSVHVLVPKPFKDWRQVNPEALTIIFNLTAKERRTLQKHNKKQELVKTKAIQLYNFLSYKFYHRTLGTIN